VLLQRVPGILHDSVLTHTHTHHILRCYCNAYQGFSTTPSTETFCASVVSASNPTSVVSSKGAVNLTAAEVATLTPAAQFPYAFKVSGMVDIFAAGYYTFCLDAEKASSPSVSLSVCLSVCL
jgi:hypothetical protein